MRKQKLKLREQAEENGDFNWALNPDLQTDSCSSDSDLQLNEEIYHLRKTKLYDVQDIQRELEELTEDDDEVKKASLEEREHIKIKRKIKMSMKRYRNPPQTELEFYSIGRVLGKGGYGKVNLAKQKLTRKICAVKSINKIYEQNEHDHARIFNEQLMVKVARLRHPNIVQMFEYIETENYYLFFMELCPGGDMLHYIRRRRKLEEPMAKNFFRQIMKGIAYLHARNIAHRDIKLENILLSNIG